MNDPYEKPVFLIFNTLKVQATFLFRNYYFQFPTFSFGCSSFRSTPSNFYFFFLSDEHGCKPL